MMLRIFVLMIISAFISAPALGEDVAQRQCLIADAPTAGKIATWISQRGVCNPGCRGCGCNGGPGYRNYKTNKCVGWADLNKTCGPPPHNDCLAECEPTADECQLPNELGAALETRRINWPSVDLPEVALPDKAKDE